MSHFNHMYYPSQGRWAQGMAHRDQLVESGEYIKTGEYMPGLGLGQFLTHTSPDHRPYFDKEWWSKWTRDRYTRHDTAGDE